MASIEQYRGEIDRLLSDAGIDYRVLQSGNGAQYAWQKLEAWSRNNPDDPRAKAFAKDRQKFAGALESAVRGLANPNEMTFRDNETMIRDTLFGAPGEQGPLAPPKPGDAAPAGPTGPDPRKQYLDWITQFTQAMGRPAGPGDPIFDSLTKMGAARASMNVGAQGVRVGRGGLGEAAIQQGANAAVMPYQMQRKQLEAQGLGMLDQARRGWEGLDQNAHLLNQNAIQMNNQNMAQAWAQSQNQNQAGGALAGGLVGGLLGGAATIATGGAAAPLIPGLMTGGSQIGAGIAGNSGPSYRPQQYRPYSPNSSGY